MLAFTGRNAATELLKGRPVLAVDCSVVARLLSMTCEASSAADHSLGTSCCLGILARLSVRGPTAASPKPLAPCRITHSLHSALTLERINSYCQVPAVASTRFEKL